MLNPELAADMKLDHDAFIFEIDYSSLELPDLEVSLALNIIPLQEEIYPS